MRNLQQYQDPNYLKTKQYQNSTNLDARANLHRRFSSNEQGWLPWVFEHLALQPGMNILECGCGPGWLWSKNLDRIPADCTITLTDMSSGMVAETETALAGNSTNFQFQTANIQALPFEDDSFDLVVANHMLYHVPNLNRGLSEVKRVLRGKTAFGKAGGRFLAATNGNDHMREQRQLRHQLIPDWPIEYLDLSFSLENGQEQLETYFSDMQLHLFPDTLLVTEVEPLIAYILSMTEAKTAATPQKLTQLREYIDAEITENGAFHITKSVCLFIANV